MSVMVTETGTRFGILTVAERVGDKEYRCVCDCGGETRARVYDLFNGRRVSCGCRKGNFHNGKLATGFNAKHYYKVSRAGAQKRGYAWELTFGEYTALTTAPCSYCASTEGVGVDRIDNNAGYTYTNCQPLCWTCNRAKNNASESDFVMWVLRVYRNFTANGMLKNGAS